MVHMLRDAAASAAAGGQVGCSLFVAARSGRPDLGTAVDTVYSHLIVLSCKQGSSKRSVWCVTGVTNPESEYYPVYNSV